MRRTSYLFSGFADLETIDLNYAFATSAEVVMKASGLRLEAIKAIARERGVEIKDTACRCINEELLVALADAHVRRLKAYFNNAKRHIAELDGNELATFVDFCKTFKRSQNTESNALSWSDIDTESIKEQFRKKVRQLTSSCRLQLHAKVNLVTAQICDKLISEITYDTTDLTDVSLHDIQCGDILNRVYQSWLYYEKTQSVYISCFETCQLVRKIMLSARYHIFTEEDHHIAC